MTARIIVGAQNAPLFGISEPLPIEGFPPGRVRIRMRNTDWPRVYVKTTDGIKVWIPVVKDGKWTPGYQQGENRRVG